MHWQVAKYITLLLSLFQTHCHENSFIIFSAPSYVVLVQRSSVYSQQGDLYGIEHISLRDTGDAKNASHHANCPMLVRKECGLTRSNAVQRIMQCNHSNARQARI